MVRWGGVGLISFLGTCTLPRCYVKGGVGWGGVGLKTLRGTCTFIMVCVTLARYVARLPHVLNIGEHKSHGTFIKDLASLAHALHIHLLLVFWCLPGQTLHKKPEWSSTTALLSQEPSKWTPHGKFFNKWKPIAFAQKDKSHGGTNESRRKWARSFHWRHNASICISNLEKLPKCLWQVWKQKLLTRVGLGMGILTSKEHVQFFFQRDKEK